MNEFGYIRIRSAVPEVRVADVDYNVESILQTVRRAAEDRVEVLVLPELGITGYTCGDLFNQSTLLHKAEEGIGYLISHWPEDAPLTAVGCPVICEGRLFNCAIVIANGEIAGIVPKIHIPNYGEFYEKRWFDTGYSLTCRYVDFLGNRCRIGNDILFRWKGVNIGAEICEDLWVPEPPGGKMALAGADVILNLSASDELIGKREYIRNLVRHQSESCRCVYAYASAGKGESSTDLVFLGNAIIADDGKMTIGDAADHSSTLEATIDADIEKLRGDRAKYNSFFDDTTHINDYETINIESSGNGNLPTHELNIIPDPNPFVPADEKKLKEHCEEIIGIQASGLVQRLRSIGCRKVIVGVSGGLDSTLALLVAVKAFDMLRLPREGILGITMPGLATTSRTKSNAVKLMELLGVTVMEIPIGMAVAQHFEDIGQDPEKYDAAFENSQARERTQILMDKANQENGIVIGTGDMSELALGWCTYNGDHMSMYGVNAGVPKTLVKYLVRWFASEYRGEAGEVLLDIIDTPISPELVPSGGDEITQKTEDLVGPYELHDFFLYHFLRNSFRPKKIFMLAKRAFAEAYDEPTILKWMGIFFRRFFNQQFKRSCMPDGPKVGSVSLSPRGDWRMPSDASSALWLKEIDELMDMEAK